MVRKRPEAPPDLFDLPLEPQRTPETSSDPPAESEEAAAQRAEGDGDALEPARGSDRARAVEEEAVGEDLESDSQDDNAQDDNAQDAGGTEQEIDDWLEDLDGSDVSVDSEAGASRAAKPENLTLFESTGDPEGALPDDRRAPAVRADESSDISEPDQLAGSWVEPVLDRDRDPADESQHGDLDRDSDDSRVGIGERIAAGAADGLIQVATLALALLAMVWRGLQPSLAQWPGLLLFLLAFSFLYWTFSLAFWGQTPGMAWARLKARDFGDQPLTFGQTALRWLGAWLTVGLAGLPLLVALSGRSFSDRLSRSETRRLAEVEEALRDPPSDLFRDDTSGSEDSP